MNQEVGTQTPSDRFNEGDAIGKVVAWDHSDKGKEAFILLAAVAYLRSEGQPVPAKLEERMSRAVIAEHEELGEPIPPDLGNQSLYPAAEGEQPDEAFILACASASLLSDGKPVPRELQARLVHAVIAERSTLG